MDEGRPPDPATDLEPIEAAPPPGDGRPAGGSTADGADVPVAAQPDDVALEPRSPSRALVAISLVLIAALVVFAFLGGRIVSPSDAEPPAGAPRLAVTDGNGALHVVGANGESVSVFDVDDAAFAIPAWSPDGTRIAITGQGDEGVRLYLFDVAAAPDNDAPTILYDDVDHPPFYLYWSPDGRQIAFLTTEPNGIALRVVPADGSGEARVVREGAPLYWDWLGNDHLVAHIGSSGEGSFLGEVDLQGTSTERVPLEPGFFRSPAVSRDGTHRAYVTTGQDSTGIVTVESIDRSSRQVVPVFGVAAVSFDPTGTTLAYVGSEAPRAQEIGFPIGPLRVLDPASGQSRTLLSEDVIGFFWSPDGATIAALTLTPPDEEIVGVPGARLASAAGPRPGADRDAPPPAAGVPLTLVFVDADSATVRSTRAAEVTSRFVNNILPYYDQYALSHRMWSPDSSAIALPLDADGDDRVFVIPADGSPMTQLEGAELGFWSP